MLYEHRVDIRPVGAKAIYVEMFRFLIRNYDYDMSFLAVLLSINFFGFISFTISLLGHMVIKSFYGESIIGYTTILAILGMFMYFDSVFVYILNALNH